VGWMGWEKMTVRHWRALSGFDNVRYTLAQPRSADELWGSLAMTVS